MPQIGTDRPSAIADPLDAALTPRTCSNCAAVYRVPARLLPALRLVRSAGLRPDGLLPGLRRLRPLRPFRGQRQRRRGAAVPGAAVEGDKGEEVVVVVVVVAVAVVVVVAVVVRVRIRVRVRVKSKS